MTEDDARALLDAIEQRQPLDVLTAILEKMRADVLREAIPMIMDGACKSPKP